MSVNYYNQNIHKDNTTGITLSLIASSTLQFVDFLQIVAQQDDAII